MYDCQLPAALRLLHSRSAILPGRPFCNALCNEMISFSIFLSLEDTRSKSFFKKIIKKKVVKHVLPHNLPLNSIRNPWKNCKVFILGFILFSLYHINMFFNLLNAMISVILIRCPRLSCIQYITKNCFSYQISAIITDSHCSQYIHLTIPCWQQVINQLSLLIQWTD